MNHLPIMSPTPVKDTLKELGRCVESWLSTCLATGNSPASLCQAMEYSLLAGGKRLRPVLCLCTASMGGLTHDKVMPFAAAIEMIHTYSLIHDDLPAMDDDDLRRGKPSSHKAFGEATAILAGDALLTDSFAFMCSVPASPENLVRAVRYLAEAAGSSGMVGGQVLDMEYTGTTGLTLKKLQTMHAMKTGALIRASCVCGALISGADAQTVSSLERYGAALGAAFQIADDILDVTADTATLGKPAGSDIAQGKNTYPSLLGLEQSRALAEEQKCIAIDSLQAMDNSEAAFLRGLASYVVSRAC